MCVRAAFLNDNAACHTHYATLYHIVNGCLLPAEVANNIEDTKEIADMGLREIKRADELNRKRSKCIIA